MDSNPKGKEGEKLIYELATNSFLSYWCYPNPFDELGNKKEICDLLIHFNDTLILICVKNYEFKGFYERYFRNVIEKDVRQLYGAEKKILNPNLEIQIKNKDGRIHHIDKKKIRNVHRIMVHLGDKVHFYPFNVNTKNDKFVHIFDKSSFTNLIEFLDTIKDFEEYLEKREKAFIDKEVFIMPSEEDEFDSETSKQFFKVTSNKDIKKMVIMISGTESDLLARYIINQREFPKEIISDEFNGMLFQIDGEWDDFNNKEQVKKKLEDDKVSYFVDEFIKREIIPNSNESNIEFAKELLSFNRFERRIIAKSLFELIEQHNNKRGFFIARRYGEIAGVGIIYVFYTIDMTQDQVNEILSIVFDTYSVHTNYKNEKLILIASTTDCKQFKFGLEKDIKPFDKETEELMKENIRLLKWFTNTTETKFTEKEYPDIK